MKRIGNITAFYSEFDQFSNFFRCEILINGIVFNCTEQAFMYTKAKYFKDEKKALQILAAEMPWLQKKLGREVRPFNKDAWDRVAPHFMNRIISDKLQQHAEIRKVLMKTDETIIVEASEYDLIWGAGVGIDDPRIEDPKQWPGKNGLGEIFMKQRAKYHTPGSHP
jgi:ribA/ribD-fused uncharacterized protein